MNPSVRAFAALLVLLAGTVLAGCSLQSTKDSSVPWAQPANWEGEVPGMGSAGAESTPGSMH